MPHAEQPSYAELAARNAELTARVSELLVVVAGQAPLVEALRSGVAALRRQGGPGFPEFIAAPEPGQPGG